MNEQPQKRGPGRPRKAARRQHIDITLSQEIIDFIDAQPVSRSRFIEMVIGEMEAYRKWRFRAPMKDWPAIIQQEQERKA